jgi:hypothetical protein
VAVIVATSRNHDEKYSFMALPQNTLCLVASSGIHAMTASMVS